MATYYVDYISGNDTNAGTSWALAKKTLLGVQNLPGLTQSDTILVAKTPDPDNVGAIRVTNGSNALELLDPVVTTIFDNGGDYFDNLGIIIRNETLSSPSTNDFKRASTGSCHIAHRVRYIDPVANPTMANIPHYMGSFIIDKGGSPTYPTLPSDGDYVVLRVNSRSATTRYAISINGTLTLTGGIPTSVNLTDAKGLYSGTLNTTTNGTTKATTRPISLGSALSGYDEFEKLPDTGTEYLWFNMGSSLSGVTNIWALNVYCVDTASSQLNNSITGMWVVHGMPSTTGNYLNSNIGSYTAPTGAIRIATKGLNHVMGPGDQRLQLMQLYQWGIKENLYTGVGDPPPYNRYDSHMAGFSTFNWNQATADYATSRLAATAMLDYDVNFSAGGTSSRQFFIRAGTNKSTDAQDGVTRAQCQFDNGYNTPGTKNFELYVRSADVSGFGLYNWNQAAKFKLNSTRVNASITYDDLSCNNYGYYFYTDNSTCPDKMFFHYKTFGPNNTLYIDSGIASCTAAQWSATFTKSFGSLNTVGLVYNAAFNSGSLVEVAWNAVTNTSFVDFDFNKFRYKAMAWTSAATSAVAEAIIVGKQKTVAITSTASSTVTLANKRTRSALWSSVASTVNSWSAKLATTVGWSAPNTSTASTSVKATRPLTLASSTSVSSPWELFKSKGLSWTSTNTLGLIFSYTPILPMSWASPEVAAVAASLSRNRGYEFATLDATVMTMTASAERSAPFSSSNSVASSFLLGKAVNPVWTSTAVVSAAVVAAVARKVQPVTTVVAAVSASLAKGTTTAFNVTGLSAVAEAIGRSRAATWSSSAVTSMTQVLGNFNPMSWASTSNSAMAVATRKSGRVAFTVLSSVAASFANTKSMAWLSSAASSVSMLLGKAVTPTWSAAALMAQTFGIGVTKQGAWSSSASTTSQFEVLRNRGIVFYVPMTHNMSMALARSVGQTWLSHNEPVVSILLNMNRPVDYTIVEQSGTTMTLAGVEAGIGFVVGEYVTVDGIPLRALRANSLAAFGSTSAASQAIGVGRGVQFNSAEGSAVVVEASRLVPVTWLARQQSFFGFAPVDDRLDEFFVQYEDFETSSAADGSILMGVRRLNSSGLLHDTNPVLDVEVPADEVYNITVVEDD